jgi:hypothetical protein
MASSLGAAFGVAISAALFTALSELDTSFTAMSDLFLGRTENVAIRFAAAVALLFNVLMVIPLVVVLDRQGRVDGKPLEGFGPKGSLERALRPQLTRLTR